MADSQVLFDMTEDRPACQFVIGYEREVPGSDVADPRIRCNEPATVQLDDGMWVCPRHAQEVRDQR
jgi:hypothetical protein